MSDVKAEDVRNAPSGEGTTIRVLMLGDSAVGKSRLLERFMTGKWTDACTPGLTFVRRELEVNGTAYTLLVYDAPGSPRAWVAHRDSPYLPAISCVMLVYDVTSMESFEHVSMWLDEADATCIPIGSRILVGNKADIDKKRQVRWSDAQRVANELNMPIIETSAWNNKNIKEAFSLAIHTELERRAQECHLPKQDSTSDPENMLGNNNNC